MWEAVPAHILNGKWCPFCIGRGRTIADMTQLASLRGGECVSKEFSGMEQKLTWQCADGHQWEAIPASIKSGKWCPVCGNKKRGDALRYSITDMHQLAKARNGKCLSNEYFGKDVKLQWECEKGHQWSTVPNSIRRGSWCPVCAKQR